MGRVYDAKIKRIGNAALEMYRTRLSADFRANKEVLSKVLNTDSKFIVNKVAGYVTSQVKRETAQIPAEEQPEEGSTETGEAA